MPTGLFIGRFQPPHKGHETCIRKILEENDICVIGLRETKVNNDNPFSVAERMRLFRNLLHDVIEKIKFIRIADYDSDLTVYYGRKVGWDMKELKLDKETENISATELRGKMNE